MGLGINTCLCNIPIKEADAPALELLNLCVPWAIEEGDDEQLINCLLLRGRALYKGFGRDGEALLDLDHAATLTNCPGSIYAMRGYLKGRSGDEVGAQSDFVRARKLGIIEPEKGLQFMCRFKTDYGTLVR